MVVKVVLEVTKEVLEVTKVVEEVTIFQRATEAATRCPAWGKPPTVTHCQHRAWPARTRTKVVFKLILIENFVNIEIVARPPVFPPAQHPASQGGRVPPTSSRRWWSPSPRRSRA